LMARRFLRMEITAFDRKNACDITSVLEIIFKPMEGKKSLKRATHSKNEVTEMLRYLVQNCVTKSDVREIVAEIVPGIVKPIISAEIKASEQRMMDHTTRECAKVRGDLVIAARQQDEKTNEVIRLAEKKRLFSSSESQNLQSINPLRLTT
jgi:hypothetical protein